MRRRTVLWAFLILLVAVGLVAGGIAFLVKRDPAFYASDAMKAQPDDETVAGEFAMRYVDLKNNIRTSSDWAGVFSANELNAFFREYVDDGEEAAEDLPTGVHNPRVTIEGDRIKLACRYGDGIWSSVLSIELKPWLVKQKVNTVAVQISGAWIGSFPVESQVAMDWITEKARDSNIEVTWYRHEGSPVGLFRFFANDPQPTTQIRTVKVVDGKLAIAGRSQLDMKLPMNGAGQ